MKTANLKKLVGDRNKNIKHYFESEDAAVRWITANIANPRAFTFDELKGIVSDCLSRESEPVAIKKTATELLAEIGYGIIKTTSLKHLRSLGFQSWFQHDDLWCKYSDKNRWNAYDIYIIYKLDGEKLEPAAEPKVGDEYSLSLMSFGCKEGHVYQFCQRYNHSASGSADWVLGGNLNNLVEGLSDAFCKEFGYESLGRLNQYMPEHTIVRHGKYLKYNYEINDIYFYEDGVCDNESFKYTDKNRYLVVDYFVIDWKTKKVINPSGTHDAFVEVLQDALDRNDLVIKKEK